MVLSIFKRYMKMRLTIDQKLKKFSWKLCNHINWFATIQGVLVLPRLWVLQFTIESLFIFSALKLQSNQSAGFRLGFFSCITPKLRDNKHFKRKFKMAREGNYRSRTNLGQKDHLKTKPCAFLNIFSDYKSLRTISVKAFFGVNGDVYGDLKFSY